MNKPDPLDLFNQLNRARSELKQLRRLIEAKDKAINRLVIELPSLVFLEPQYYSHVQALLRAALDLGKETADVNQP